MRRTEEERGGLTQDPGRAGRRAGVRLVLLSLPLRPVTVPRALGGAVARGARRVGHALAQRTDDILR